MASYAELRGLLTDTALRNKVEVAVGVAADLIRTEADTGEPWDPTNHDNRVTWARGAFRDFAAVAREMWWAVLIANRALDVEQISGASDAAIQSNVNELVDHFADGS